jgi:C_GCAxxG_C_C family probable redox protein
MFRAICRAVPDVDEGEASCQYGLDRQFAFRIASGFGGGMRCGEVCGAVTGALMAIGLRYGPASVEDRTAKAACQAATSEFMKRYAAEQGTVLCRELLGYDVRDTVARKSFPGRQKEVCPRAVEVAVRILEEMGI